MLSNVKRTPDVPIHLLLLLKNSLALATPANFLHPFIAHQATQRVDLPPSVNSTKHPFSPQVIVSKKGKLCFLICVSKSQSDPFSGESVLHNDFQHFLFVVHPGPSIYPPGNTMPGVDNIRPRGYICPPPTRVGEIYNNCTQ